MYYERNEEFVREKVWKRLRLNSRKARQGKQERGRRDSEVRGRKVARCWVNSRNCTAFSAGIIPFNFLFHFLYNSVTYHHSLPAVSSPPYTLSI